MSRLFIVGTRDEIAAIDALRFCAAMGIVIRHIFHPSFAIEAAGVDLFFVISGFIMVATSRELFASRGASSTFLWRRITRIVPLYWLATGLWLAMHGGYSWETMVTSLLFIPYTQPEHNWVLPLLAVGWTLNFEMFFYLMFALALRLRRRYERICLGDPLTRRCSTLGDVGRR